MEKRIEKLSMRKIKLRHKTMKKEYDFSKGERGKFYRQDAVSKQTGAKRTAT